MIVRLIVMAIDNVNIQIGWRTMSCITGGAHGSGVMVSATLRLDAAAM